MKPAELPTLRRDVIRVYQTIAPWIADDAPALAPMVKAAATRLEYADLNLATREMTRVAVDAARDVPSASLAEVWPQWGESGSGILAFDGGLPSLNGVSAEVLIWVTDGEWGYVGVLARATGVEALRSTGWAWIPVASAQAPMGEPVDYDALTSDWGPKIFSLAIASWVLMATPTVASVREVQAPGPKLGHGRRDLPRPVKVVDLRRLERVAEPSGSGSESGREYHHQWVVRGHWRHVPHGPGKTQRRDGRPARPPAPFVGRA